MLEPTRSLEPYLEAIRRRACAVCLDAHDDGSCGLPARQVCAVERLLPDMVQLVLSLPDLPRMDDYVTAVETHICAARCPEQGASGRCERRSRAACGLYMYLPLVIEAIEEVERGR